MRRALLLATAAAIAPAPTSIEITRRRPTNFAGIWFVPNPAVPDDRLMWIDEAAELDLEAVVERYVRGEGLLS